MYLAYYYTLTTTLFQTDLRYWCRVIRNCSIKIESTDVQELMLPNLQHLATSRPFLTWTNSQLSFILVFAKTHVWWVIVWDVLVKQCFKEKGHYYRQGTLTLQEQGFRSWQAKRDMVRSPLRLKTVHRGLLVLLGSPKFGTVETRKKRRKEFKRANRHIKGIKKEK